MSFKVRTPGYCEACGKRPRYSDGQKVHPYCSKSCATYARHIRGSVSNESSVHDGLCEACHARPKRSDGATVHPYCGRSCANFAKNSGVVGPSTRSGSRMCQTCGRRPQHFDGRILHPYCGKSCAAAANKNNSVGYIGPCEFCGQAPRYFDGNTIHSCCSMKCARSASGEGNPSEDRCLICGDPVHEGRHFCSNNCVQSAVDSAPLLLDVPKENATFQSVVNQFKATWKHSTDCPTVRWVFKVIISRRLLSQYETHRAGVEARGDFVSAGMSLGNEQRRWHGTFRECLLGDEGNTETCNSVQCRLCQIIRCSFKIELFGTNMTWGRFGKGIYTTSTSSKANDYSKSSQGSLYKTLLLNKVIVGNGFKVTRDQQTLQAPPSGYDSVLAEVVPGGTLNYDELVLYNDDAIRPSYLVVYDA
ncbi:ADP-ribosylation [Coniophora puteana RWD-64-598 SS2]|uniref:ADP-ribosylation n=1 Tax=Coniophora puteana (strain RWD-64-598) TaxID=741705 RepID=A0A5M3MZ71_CONPW|nr:ADP-ribosylation [Coniophora puteana RWD-64-598 SS2]EIW84463.1 ADP-ribosylation [Coniophora puteana RWD-64-598 SS2]